MANSLNAGKVVVIGAGNVGSSIAYTIMLKSLASEIVMVDVNAQKAKGEALDMNHGIAYHKQIAIRDGGYEDCADAKLIIITAGANRKPGQTRLELANINVAIAKTICKNIMEFAKNPLIIVVSNPVDILTYIVQKETGLPASRVIGSGTMLDTARFRYLLSNHCNVDVRNVHAYIIGEHGDSEVPVWSRANIAGKPFDEFLKSCSTICDNVDCNSIFEETKNSGAEIISLKGATFYGVAMSTSRIVSAIMGDERSVLTVGSVISDMYGINDIALSLPSIVGSDGIEMILNIEISDQEQAELKNSEQKLKEVLKEVYLPVTV